MIIINIKAFHQQLLFTEWLHHMLSLKSSLFILACSVFTTLAWSGDVEFVLNIKNHRFEPSEVKVPANQRVKLLVNNQDSTPEEFESHDLNREKVIPGGAKASIFIGPLKTGRYSFMGEFNPATAKGVVIAE
jgi:Cupredoxin-like domain